MPRHSAKALLYTLLAIAGFAGNSLFTRAAMGPGLADPASYTFVRTLAGALTLLTALLMSGRRIEIKRDHFKSALFLFLYIAPFSFAYVTVPVAAGSLTAFGAVQVTLLTAGYRQGDRLSAAAWAGFALAVAGLVYLVFPGLSAPPLAGSLLMFGAGAAWGGYSIIGKKFSDPVADTTINFLLALPMVTLLLLARTSGAVWSTRGVLLAIGSGALSSGLGYMFWYAALRSWTLTQASILQLCAPVVASFGGVVLLSEPLRVRTIIAGAVILTGITTAILNKNDLTGVTGAVNDN